MVGNELLNILRTETEHGPAVAKPDYRDARIPPRGMVAHPGLGHSKPAGNIIQGQQPRVVANHHERVTGHALSSALSGWYSRTSVVLG